MGYIISFVAGVIAAVFTMLLAIASKDDGTIKMKEDKIIFIIKNQENSEDE